jgi:hypothetical protein
MIDPVTITAAVKSVFDLFKTAKEAVNLIPDPVEKATALAKLALLEQELTAKNIEIAKSFGYELCLAHVPIPGIMRDDGDYWRCTVPGCQRARLTAEGHSKESDRLWAQAQRENDGLRNDTFI